MATALQRRRKIRSRRAHALRYDHRETTGGRDEPIRKVTLARTKVQWSRKKKAVDLEFDGSEEYAAGGFIVQPAGRVGIAGYVIPAKTVDKLSDFVPLGFFIDGKAFKYDEDGNTVEMQPGEVMHEANGIITTYEGVSPHHLLSEVPLRAVCPQCGSSQKVKRNGEMGKHSYGPEGRHCEGTGQRWDS